MLLLYLLTELACCLDATHQVSEHLNQYEDSRDDVGAVEGVDVKKLILPIFYIENLNIFSMLPINFSLIKLTVH